MRGDLRDASMPSTARATRLVLERIAREGFVEVTGPRCCAWTRRADAPVGLGSLSRRMPLSAATVSPFRYRVLLAADQLAGGLEALRVTWGHRGGVAIVRHTRDDLKLHGPLYGVKKGRGRAERLKGIAL
jgi:hypothetical protein